MKKRFEKTLIGHTAAEVGLLAEHSQKVYSALEGTSCTTARVLEVTNSSIVYEYLLLPNRLDSVWRQEADTDCAVFVRIGSLLRKIHNRGDLLHGDFVLHNIFLGSAGKIFIIDPHPPAVVGFDAGYLYGVGLIEMYMFLLNLASGFGVRASLKNIVAVRRAASNFRMGYGHGRCIFSLYQAAIRFRKIRKASGFSEVNAITHLIVGLFFVVISNAQS